MDTMSTDQSNDDALANTKVGLITFGDPFNGNGGVQNESFNEVTENDQQKLSEKS
ncbi:hypothetical protein [Burkholderia sp. Ed8]|uniref:hypothetical protein n=1 Tax=Burkholderia sp. Ed8 TaxID=3112957 RepID=UPI00345DEFBB